MRKAQYGIFAAFSIMLFGGAAVTFVAPDKEYSVVENRELAKKPSLTPQKFLNGSYQKEYESYLDDQFFMRDQWVDVSGMIQQAAGKKEMNSVYFGKDGYLLEKSEESEIDQAQAEENAETLSSFLNDVGQTYGREHVSCMMIPSKALALPDKLPAFAAPLEQGGILASLKKKLANPDMLIDLKDTMQSHQDEYIYYRTDHHWTTLGAYYAYRVWAEKTKQATGYQVSHYQRETVFDDFYGTTYNKVHVKAPADEVELFLTPAQETVHVNMDDGETEADSLYFKKAAEKGFNRYNVFLSKNTFQIEIDTGADTGKTLLLVKDSFANCFVPFLTEDYEKIIMIDYRYGKLPIGAIMEQYRDITDVLVLFQTEKFMQNTKLGKLAETKTEDSTIKEFDPDDFLG